MCDRVFSAGFGPGLDSMSPARSRRSASHAVGTHDWPPQKTGWPGLRRGGLSGYNLHSVPPDSPPDCGTPTTSRLYPFGASNCLLPKIQIQNLFLTAYSTHIKVCRKRRQKGGLECKLILRFWLGIVHTAVLVELWTECNI